MALDPDLVEVLAAEVVCDPELVPVADAEGWLSESVDVADAVAVVFGAVVAVADADSWVGQYVNNQDLLLARLLPELEALDELSSCRTINASNSGNHFGHGYAATKVERHRRRME